MRSAGILFTTLALLLVQAPWIVCNCEDDAGCGPLFVECHCLDSHGHESAPRHDHTHGADECDGSHETGEPADGESPCDHVGFRLPFGTMPAAVALDAPSHATIDLALAAEHPTALVSEARIHARSDPPPERLLTPSVVTECLLL